VPNFPKLIFFQREPNYKDLSANKITGHLKILQNNNCWWQIKVTNIFLETVDLNVTILTLVLVQPSLVKRHEETYGTIRKKP
jgi:hypothetical protein